MACDGEWRWDHKCPKGAEYRKEVMDATEATLDEKDCKHGYIAVTCSECSDERYAKYLRDKIEEQTQLIQAQRDDNARLKREIIDRANFNADLKAEIERLRAIEERAKTAIKGNVNLRNYVLTGQS